MPGAERRCICFPDLGIGGCGGSRLPCRAVDPGYRWGGVELGAELAIPISLDLSQLSFVGMGLMMDSGTGAEGFEVVGSLRVRRPNEVTRLCATGNESIIVDGPRDPSEATGSRSSECHRAGGNPPEISR